MLFYLGALAVAASAAILVFSVLWTILTLTSEERCRTIEEGVKTRVVRSFSRRVNTRASDLDHAHTPPARHF